MPYRFQREKCEHGDFKISGMVPALLHTPHAQIDLKLGWKSNVDGGDPLGPVDSGRRSSPAPLSFLRLKRM